MEQHTPGSTNLSNPGASRSNLDTDDHGARSTSPSYRTLVPPQELIYSTEPTDIDDDGLMRDRSHEASTITGKDLLMPSF